MRNNTKHKAIIHSFLEGDEVQFLSGGTWYDVQDPLFFDNINYRIKLADRNEDEPNEEPVGLDQFSGTDILMSFANNKDARFNEYAKLSAVDTYFDSKYIMEGGAQHKYCKVLFDVWYYAPMITKFLENGLPEGFNIAYQARHSVATMNTDTNCLNETMPYSDLTFIKFTGLMDGYRWVWQ